LLGGSRERPAVVDPVVNRVLDTGEGVAAPVGRADDFRWPRGAMDTENPQSAAAKK
jgi:hypothetical protein